MIVKEELDGIDINDSGGELARNINKKKKSGVLQAYIDVHSMTNGIGDISSISMWNIVNQLGKYDLLCESVVNNLKEKKLPAQMNRNRFDLILARRSWNSSTMENLRCLL